MPAPRPQHKISDSRLSKKVGGEAQNLGGDFGGESVLSLGETLGERP